MVFEQEDLIDDGAVLGADDPVIRYSALVTYPDDHPSAARGKAFRFRGDGSRNMAQVRCDAHWARGATSAVVQQQTWSATPWENTNA